MAELKIFSISKNDWAGCGFFLSEAINRCTEHHSRAVVANVSGLQFPYDLRQLTGQRFKLLYDWADVIHIHDAPGRTLSNFDVKPTVITYHGSAYRMAYKKLDRTARQMGWLRTVSTIDLTLLSGASWMPDTRVNMHHFKTSSSPQFTVIHSPTSRTVKNTDSVIRVLKNLQSKDVKFDLIENTPYRDCQRRKAEGRILVDQFNLGYGCNAIEAWALGLVVVANGTPEILSAMQRRFGYIPFVRCQLEDLRATLLRLKEDAQFYKDAQERGEQFWHHFHRPEVVANVAIGYYEKAVAQYTRIDRPHKWPHVQIRYVEQHSGIQTFRGPKSQKRYKFGGDLRLGEVDARDLATGDSTRPGLLEMTDKGGRRLFRRVT